MCRQSPARHPRRHAGHMAASGTSGTPFRQWLLQLRHPHRMSVLSQLAPRAGLEPAAYCLGGKPEPGYTTLTIAPYDADWDDYRLTTPDAALLLPMLAPTLAPEAR
jgi:hypothetical protein